EYRPGSTLFLVWTQDRNDTAAYGDVRLRRDGDELLRARPDNIFLVKVSYWLGLWPSNRPGAAADPPHRVGRRKPMCSRAVGSDGQVARSPRSGIKDAPPAPDRPASLAGDFRPA